MKFIVQITPERAKILLKILELEKSGITQADLVKKMKPEGTDKNAEGIDKMVVYTFIKEALEDSRDFLQAQEWKTGKSGRGTRMLGIEEGNFVTTKEMALTLIELWDFQNGTCQKRKFVAHMINKYGLDEAEIMRRINFLKGIGELKYTDDDGLMWIEATRYRRIEEWLKLLLQQMG